MNIVRWKPQITARYVTSDIASNVALHFTGTLCCPVCRHEFEMETDGHIFWLELSSISDNVEHEIEELTKKQACPKCGVVSAVPAEKCFELEHKAAELVTLSWVEEQIEMLKKSARETA